MKTLLVIDTDELFEQRFRKAIVEERLDEHFTVRRESPAIQLERRELIADVIDRTTVIARSNSIAAVFVDLVMYERHDEEADDAGLPLAVALKELLTPTPVYVVTSKVNGEHERNLFCAATMNHSVDGVFFKSFLDGKTFSTKRLHTILTPRVIPRGTGGPAERPVGRIRESSTVTRAFSAFGGDSLPDVVKADIAQLGEFAFWTLLDRLLPDGQGTLSTLRSGRSGARVFSATAKARRGAKPTKWIIKVSTREESLRRELLNQPEIQKAGLPQHMYAHALSTSVEQSGDLFGIVSALKHEAVTLGDYLLSDRSASNAERVARLLATGLSAMYGDSERRFIRPWPLVYGLTGEAVTHALGSLENLVIPLRALGLESEYVAVRSLLKGEGPMSDALKELSLHLDYRFIHGDLNSGNVLVGVDHSPCLIDFEHSGTGSVVLDLAKLERDLVLRVADAQSIANSQWSELKAWRTLHDDIAHQRDRSDRFKSLSRFARVFREGLLNGSDVELESEALLLASLGMYVRALSNDTLSLQKRALAAVIASDLISRMDTSKKRAAPSRKASRAKRRTRRRQR
jgi:hypothetical protein